jgi:flagellar basal-body rod protein FlgF
MSDGIYAALSGAVAQGVALDSTATNVANAATAGYHGQRPVFHEMLSRAGGSTLRYTAVTATQIDTASGPVRGTGRPLDVALAKDDFLAVQTPGGERYTRAGSLRLTNAGGLETSGGEPVLSDAGRPITVDPHAEVTIAPDGEVKANGASAGHLRIVTFAKPEAMSAQGGTLLAAGGAGPAQVSKGQLSIGALEDSNATPVRGMTDLITASRLFETFQNAISTFHDADRKVIEIPGS